MKKPPQRSAVTNSPAASAGQQRGWHDFGLLALLFALTLLAYWPALNGGRLWDDEIHITRPELQSFHGLWRIWFEPGATYQYYPLLYGAFWLEHRIWADATIGYHLLNVFLHALCAWLVIKIVRRLEIGGAWLAGLAFALHPVCVEAVAWISEQKSTLSGVFYLSSMLLYLRFDRSRRWRVYAAASGLFLCALLSKSVTATLPAALLVVLWWKRGKLEVKRDVAPLLPWLTLGAIFGLFTAWVERHYVHAEGADFALSLLDRCLLAGRLPWHYLLHIAWPADLSFFYPRFTIDSRSAIQYLLPALTAMTFAGLAWRARKSRGPLAAALLFVGTLVPVLGFFNVYPFRYSWIADHFSYLASLAVIVPAAALASRLRSYTTAASAVLLATLGYLTWVQSHNYTGIETLWRATLQRDPSSWMVHYNLGVILGADPQRHAEAISEYREAVRYKPDFFEGHANLASLLAQTPGHLDEALTEYQAALRINPGAAKAHAGYGLALMQVPQGLSEAVSQLETAVQLDPRDASARENLAIALWHAPRGPERGGEAGPRRDPARPFLSGSPQHSGRVAAATARPRGGGHRRVSGRAECRCRLPAGAL